MLEDINIENLEVNSEWTEEEIFKLIVCVESRPILWNAKDGKYKNKIERQSVWNRMANIDFDGEKNDSELMAKWSNLRIQFRSYFSKYKKTKSGEGAKDIVKWKFFDAMSFVGRAEEEQASTTVSNLLDLEDETRDSFLSTSNTKVRKLSQASTGASTSSAAHIVAAGMRDAVDKLQEQRQNQREDEFDSFGKYVATELRSMNNSEAARRVRFKVARCLMDAIDEEKN